MAVSKLTGRPVSKEMEDVLRHLENGIHVPIGEIEKTPEIMLARSRMGNTEPTYRSPGRRALREHALKELRKNGAAVLDAAGRIRYDGDVRKGSRLDIVIGLPASGKSSAIVDTISQEFHSRIIDNDEAKKLFPEYDDGWGAGTVNEEAQMIADILLRSALSGHENIVLPKVGSDPEKMRRIIGLAKRSGYEVNVHLVDLAREKALGRMLCRFLEEGRFLDPALIDRYCNDVDGNKISRCFEALKKGGDLDGYSKWDNDVGRGERPILIEARCTGEFIRDARTPEDRTADIRGDGGRGYERSRGTPRYAGPSRDMGRGIRGRGAGKDGKDLQPAATGDIGKEIGDIAARESIRSRLASYESTIRNREQGSIESAKVKRQQER